VDCGLLIAAGGGGDAIAAAIIHDALEPTRRRPAIATYSWDRLLIDPLPGPRDASDFEGLEPVGEHNYRVTPNSTPRAPAGSTLPRLAAELDADLYLLDPRDGAQGLGRQIAELAELLDAPSVTIVDVGGDILAHGDEPTLRSPLADSLVLAATAPLADDVQLLVTGPGVDGELPKALVLDRYHQLRARVIHRLAAADTEPFRRLFEWHPSEATGLLCAAAAGTRGTAEIRDRRYPVALTQDTPDVHVLDHPPALETNRLARALLNTRSLTAAEDAVRAAGRDSEIDYERRKAHQRQHAPATDAGPLAPAPLLDRLADIRADALARGIDFITLRGLAERLGVTGAQLAELQHQLRRRHPGEYTPPIWKLRRSLADELPQEPTRRPFAADRDATLRLGPYSVIAPFCPIARGAVVTSPRQTGIGEPLLLLFAHGGSALRSTAQRRVSSRAQSVGSMPSTGSAARPQPLSRSGRRGCFGRGVMAACSAVTSTAGSPATSRPGGRTTASGSRRCSAPTRNTAITRTTNQFAGAPRS
jgi:hypothetical protein